MPIVLSAEHDCLHLQIKPPDRGVSCVDSYCISYQSAESSEWTEVYTDGVAEQVTVTQLQPHKEYCFTCKAMCRPGASLTSDTTSFFRTHPCAPPGAPTVKQVESESVTLVWDVPTSVGEGVLITGYVLEFRECTKEHGNEKPWKPVKSTNRECILHGLKRETDYTVRVSAICVNDEISLPSSETVFSPCLKSTHSGEVGSGLFKNQSLRINKGNPSIYRLQAYQKMKENDFNQYVFGRKVEDVKNKVILLLGSTGAGKTTLINVMVNYILGVEWQDPHRFKLINEVTNRTQAESQTPNVSSYELFSQPGFQIPYSLTIVDTPGFGDTKGIAQDKLITKQIKSFLCSPLGIDHIDAVCLVVQASLVRLSVNQKYIFDSVLSIFGKDIAENIIILVTFADGKNIPALEAIKAADLPCQKNKKGQPTHFKFNNTTVFAVKKVEKHTAVGSDSDDDDEDDDQKLNEIVWTSTFRQMKAFFKTLGSIESKDLTLTIKVLEERERLEKAMTSLTPQINAGLSKVSEMKRFKQCLENQNDKMNQNENFEQEIEVMKANRTPVNCFNMNCNTCFVTCHSNCFLPAEDPVQNCAVMENDHCIICPGNCHYSFHSRENFMWTYETKVETKTIKELKENFMAAKGTFMDTNQMLEALEKDLCGIKDKLKKLITLSTDCLKRLDEIALKPKSLSTAEYLEILIKTEKEEKRPGFEDRIVELKNIKKDALLLENIARGVNPLEEDLLVT